MIALGLVLSALTGDPRALLVREAWTGMLGGLIGVWLLASVLYGRPALMVIFRSFVLVKAGEDGLRAWEGRWGEGAGFRHSLRVLTAVWGVASLLNAFAQLAFAYLQPTDRLAAALATRTTATSTTDFLTTALPPRPDHRPIEEETPMTASRPASWPSPLEPALTRRIYAVRRREAARPAVRAVFEALADATAAEVPS
ncbi:VC0807 family protein [Kitasatospora cathayae]|uniref:RDD domain-containing protein n=1 Tax=Kitasatospora cathayae TaxID=3004092 RepID=A0ABY7QFM3_9ACTN|nr:VC0807 family protein [Kitasatospora sp. HUAS 3-15]WBP91361.1 hypothetical protein O1G21_39455 [Kitasatospora sp. HUAS 3-15]WBP92051.1 hypothetical protein O1G21_40410 [Kitasatospora sp. HUAS 3-15]